MAEKRIEAALRHRLLYNGYVVSYPKCGRTWLNSILLHYVLRHYDNASQAVPFEWAPRLVRHTWYRGFPNICFTHDISSPAIHYTAYPVHFDPSKYIARRCVLLIRDPRDVVNSYYYHSMKKVEKNQLAPDTTLSDFLHHGAYGIQATVAFFNLWAPVIRENANVISCRYEDLSADAVGTTSRLLSFFGVSNIDREAVTWSVQQNTFENLQNREKQSKRLDGLTIETDSLRVRRGQIGGFRDTWADADIAYADAVVGEHLDLLFGYSPASET